MRSLTPDMTYREIVQRLGDMLDVGSGIYILKYRVDDAYMIPIPLAGDDVQLGVAGEKLLEAKEPLETAETDPLAEGGSAERAARSKIAVVQKRIREKRLCSLWSRVFFTHGLGMHHAPHAA